MVKIKGLNFLLRGAFELKAVLDPIMTKGYYYSELVTGKLITIDGYRDALFEKLNLKTRLGLVMYTIKNGIVQV